MNIKETFLKLTQYTIPHGKEDILRKYLPDAVERDEFGNYSMTIGKSETLFTSHLDTVSTEMEKVNHVIEGNIIKTDGTTILGGDNKTGVCILLNMIEHNIPGTYYFFAGEEPTAKEGGLYGSKHALAANPEFFKKFKRAICFDRKYEGSIVIRQMARYTCSNEFVQALTDQFETQGLPFRPDETGWYTDTAVFINVIPEVTNLSSGTYKEHSENEYVDMNYLERVAEAALHIDWENLPTVRVPKKETSREEASIHTFKKFKNLKSDRAIFNKIDGYMSNFNFLCLNDDEFEPGLNMIFSQWHKEQRLYIKVEDGIVWLNNERVGTLKDFEQYVGIGFEQKVDLERFVEICDDLADKIESDTIDSSRLKKILAYFGVELSDLEEYMNSKDCQLKDYCKYNSRAHKLIIK
jgi:hypothetical protein